MTVDPKVVAARVAALEGGHLKERAIDYRHHKILEVQYAYIDGRVAALTGYAISSCPHPGRVFSAKMTWKIKEGRKPSRKRVLRKDLLRWAWMAGWQDKADEINAAARQRLA